MIMKETIIKYLNNFSLIHENRELNGETADIYHPKATHRLASLDHHNASGTLTPEIIDAAAHDPEPMVRRQLARTVLDIPPHIMEKIHLDPDVYVRGAAFSHPNNPNGLFHGGSLEHLGVDSLSEVIRHKELNHQQLDQAINTLTTHKSTSILDTNGSLGSDLLNKHHEKLSLDQFHKLISIDDHYLTRDVATNKSFVEAVKKHVNSYKPNL